MRPQPKFEKVMEMSKLERGDIIKLVTGETVEFQSLKQKNFTGTMPDGKLYNIGINLFDSLIEKATKDNKFDELKSLKSGELFYFIKGNNAVVLIFNYIQGDRIFATNPINNGNVKLSVGMYAGKIDTLISQQIMKKLV